MPLASVFHVLSCRPRSVWRKKSSMQTADNSWLTQFYLQNDIPVSLMEVFADHNITLESVLAEITEQDLVDMKLVAGQKIILRQVIARLTKSTSHTTVAAPMSTVARSALSQVPSSFPPFKLEDQDELAKIEAEVCEPKDANTSPHKTDHISFSAHVTPPQASSPSNGSNGPEGKQNVTFRSYLWSGWEAVKAPTTHFCPIYAGELYDP